MRLLRRYREIVSVSNYEVLTLLTSVVAVLVSVAAIVVSVRLTKRWNKEVQKHSEELHRQQLLTTSRQTLFSLWPYITGLSEVDPNRPVEVDVIKNANALELVALCWEAEIIDRTLIRRAFADTFVNRYNEIARVGATDACSIDGLRLLGEMPSVMRLFRELSSEKENRGVIPPVRS